MLDSEVMINISECLSDSNIVMDQMPGAEIKIDTPSTFQNPDLIIIEQEEAAESPPTKRRRKKSVVWDHFTIETVGPECRRATCNQCQQSFAYSTGTKIVGTSHLKRHVAKGSCLSVLRNQAKNQLASKMSNSEQPRRRCRNSSDLMFDQDRCRSMISNMMIMHDYPLHMVEDPEFIQFVHNLQPCLNNLTFDIIQGDCVATYLREKMGITKLMEKIPGRLCLALDMWTSSHTVGYVFLTGYYVDNDWKLQRRLLNVVMEPFPDSSAAFSHAVSICLSDWSLEKRLFSLTIDQPEINMAHLRAEQSIKSTQVLSGQFMIQSCIARTLSNMAKDIIAVGQETIKRVRDSVKYVTMSDCHGEKFLDIKQQLMVPSTRSLFLDNQSQWNTTYEMLMAAADFQQVFSCLEVSDSDYKDTLSLEDWKTVATILSCLKLLLDTANILATPTLRTANIYFHEACKIQMEVSNAAATEESSINIFAKPMQARFDKYWTDSCLILAAAVVMDPRFKLKLVEYNFSRIYGEHAETYIKMVEERLHELFLEYVLSPSHLTPVYADGKDSNLKNEETFPGDSTILSNEHDEFDAQVIVTTGQESRSELEIYLEESLLSRVQDIDVADWWKQNQLRYPVLSKMSRDILSIPVCTVGPESVFDASRKEMSSFRCSLLPETVEALICAKEWLKDKSSETSSEKVESSV